MRNDITIISEEHAYTSDDKLKLFGYGEWVEEVDIFRFIYCGYTCLIRRTIIEEFGGERCCPAFGGHLCGYVHIPEEHAVFGESVENIPIDVHWALTFCECDGKEHLIGFDCAHSGDLVPSEVNRHKEHRRLMNEIFPPPEGLENHPWFNPTYKNMSYCIDECCHIVDQLEVIQTAATASDSDENV